ncbi:MAG: hypothetical protein ACOH2R_19890 [Pseudomonas sp.]
MFFKRGHRSAQGHLNEALWTFADDAYSNGHLPLDEYEAMKADAWNNNLLVSAKTKCGYIHPDEEMLIHFLQRFCGVSEAQAAEARALHSQWQRELYEVLRDI